ncbi:hypothetical protein L7F22_051058 [Adiantum nelumboides]|nr:hypothetical protein [Adiantum nelumboides]
MVESTIETSLSFELDEEVNTGSSSTPSDNLFWTEEDPSEDHSTDFGLGTTHNYKSDKKRKKYKRRQYRANVRAKMNKKQSTANWLYYLEALDAHRKLVDNWGEHLQSVMWFSPQPHDIAQLEIAKKPKLSRDSKVVYTKAQRTPINGSSGVYDGPAIVKEIELADPGAESKPVFITQDLTEVEEVVLKELLKEFKDIFAWTYHDMKGVPPSVAQHTIPMISTAKPMQQRSYPMNPKYAKIVQEELEKLIECGFIYPIEHSEWVSPIVIVPKKNGKLRVCVDLKKVNAATRRDHYPLPYLEHVLERVVGKEAYSFLDGYSGYNQIIIALENQAKTTFIIEFGMFAFRVMAFVLTNVPATFQRLINTAFKEYLRDFCEAFLDDLYIYSSWEEHLSCLKKVFEKCRLYRISLNPFKCQFWVSTDEGKIKVILELPPPHNYKGVQRFMGHVGYYRRFI